ncbi:uncharacterized protein si:dkey-22i16.9 [Sardina pilchardus]|uniref:uncharacterized protein si:dkey-22i16.9 n=1 Tax=Sardina pilchardus TaxID=27697 RepID=UPI002E10FFA3
MGGNVFMLVCILILCMCPSVLGVIKTGILHETITLPCSQSCSGTMTWTLVDTGLVIKCTNRSCETGTGFENGFSISNERFDGKRSCGLTISSLKFNDQGIYSGYCDGRYYCAVTLDVLVPVDVNVSTGNNVSLPCHVAIKKTIENTTVSFLWEKYWKKKWDKVLRLEKGNFTYGPMKGRVSVPEDGYKSGDLPLRITDVRPSDQGVYRCRYLSTGDTGVPGPLMLIVKENTWSCAIKMLVTSLVTGIVLILGYFCCYKLKGIPNPFRRQPVPKAPVPEENVDSESIPMKNYSTVHPTD